MFSNIPNPTLSRNRFLGTVGLTTGPAVWAVIGCVSSRLDKREMALPQQRNRFGLRRGLAAITRGSQSQFDLDFDRTMI